MTHALNQLQAKPKHGTRAYREQKHVEYLGLSTFECGSDFARVVVQGLTAFAHVTPLEMSALSKDPELRIRMNAFEDTSPTKDLKHSGYLYIHRLNESHLTKLAPGLGSGLAVWTTDLMGTPLLKKDGYAPDQWALIISDEFYDKLHAKDDPYWWTDACVALTLSYALLAHRDGEKTTDRDAIVYEFKGLAKRALFALGRDYNCPRTRARWNEVREMLAQIYFRGRPVLELIDETECDELDITCNPLHAKRLGPFQSHELEAWKVSRHVLENDHKVDAALAARDLARQKAERQAKLKAKQTESLTTKAQPVEPINEDDLPKHPDRVRKPSARGAAKLTPDIFFNRLGDLPIQLCIHVHFRFNRAGEHTLSLEQIEVSTGRSMWRRRRRPKDSRRRARVRRVALRCVRLGFAKRRRHRDSGQELPVLMHATKKTRHASFRVMIDPGAG